MVTDRVPWRPRLVMNNRVKLKLKFLVYSVLEPAVGYLTTLHCNSQQGTHPTLV